MSSGGDDGSIGEGGGDGRWWWVVLVGGGFSGGYFRVFACQSKTLLPSRVSLLHRPGVSVISPVCVGRR